MVIFKNLLSEFDRENFVTSIIFLDIRTESNSREFLMLFSEKLRIMIEIYYKFTYKIFKHESVKFII